MKFVQKKAIIVQRAVAPLAGAWVEIDVDQTTVTKWGSVAPLAGAWVEMYMQTHKSLDKLSLPSRERGLKFR